MYMTICSFENRYFRLLLIVFFPSFAIINLHANNEWGKLKYKIIQRGEIKKQKGKIFIIIIVLIILGI
jgi:hypothetical protein